MEKLSIIKEKFSQNRPLFFNGKSDLLVLEMKPYLQPFEELLAIRELKSLIGSDDQIENTFGYYVVKTDLNEEYLSDRLTYWQRIGRQDLVPTTQKSLELTQNGFTKMSISSHLHNARRLRYGPHDLHEYRGKFFPQLVRSLINIAAIPDDGIVLDPMCGSGTTPCEALSSGRNALGLDLNPLSVLISRIKSALVMESPSTFKKQIEFFLNIDSYETVSPEVSWGDRDLEYLRLWFSEEALVDISSIIATINKNIDLKIYQDFLKVVLSNIIRSVSWQKESDLRVRKEIKSYESGMAINLFKNELEKQFDKIYSYLTILPQKVERSFEVIEGNSLRVDKYFSDYLKNIDLLITSPPYATALPYLDTDRLSLIVLGLLSHRNRKYTEWEMIGTREISEKLRRETWDSYNSRRHILPTSIQSLIDFIALHNHKDGVGFRRKNLPALLGRYFINMYDAMKAAHKLLKPNASAFYVVGNNSTVVNGEKIQIDTDKLLFELGASAGWKQIEIIPMELITSRDIFRENRGSSETILHFKA